MKLISGCLPANLRRSWKVFSATRNAISNSFVVGVGGVNTHMDIHSVAER